MKRKRFLVKCRAWNRVRFFLFLYQFGCAKEALNTANRLNVKWYHKEFSKFTYLKDYLISSSITCKKYQPTNVAELIISLKNI